MMKINAFFVLLFAFGFCSNAFAAPSVKRLGVGNSYTGTTNAANAQYGNFIRNTGTNTNTKTAGRTAAVRSVGTGQLKTANVGKTTAATNNADTARLSVGKYLHTSGVKSGIIKPIGSVTPDDTGLNEMSARIDYLENQVNNKLDKDVLNGYYDKNEVDAKIIEAKQDVVAEITTSIQNTVETAVNETVEPAVTQKISQLLGSDIDGVAHEPDFKPEIFNN